MSIEIIEVGPERADDVLAVVKAAFAARPALDPPADALGETVDTIAAMLAPGGGLLALDDGRPVGTVVLDPVDDAVYLRRGAASRASWSGRPSPPPPAVPVYDEP